MPGGGLGRQICRDCCNSHCRLALQAGAAALAGNREASGSPKSSSRGGAGGDGFGAEIAAHPSPLQNPSVTLLPL